MPERGNFSCTPDFLSHKKHKRGISLNRYVCPRILLFYSGKKEKNIRTEYLTVSAGERQDLRMAFLRRA